MPSASLTDNVASDMSAWWPKSASKEDEKATASAAATLSVVASGGSLPGSAPPSLPQSPSARRGVNLIDEVVIMLPAMYCPNFLSVIFEGLLFHGRLSRCLFAGQVKKLWVDFYEICTTV